MKLIALALILITATAHAAPHWVEVQTSSANKLYIDDSDVRAETFEGHNYRGYTALIVFANPSVFEGTGLTTPYTVVSETAVIVYDCQNQAGIGKRLVMVDDQKAGHEIDDVWRLLDHGVAIELRDAVKAKVCR
jgi:FlaG/FlaF family flagellin (archaellin)